MKSQSKHDIRLFMVLLTTLLFCTTSRVFAQNESEIQSKDQQSFYFIYVAPDRAVNIDVLRKELSAPISRISNNNYPAIFYLANGREPVIVEFNLGKNNQGDYETKFDYWLINNKSWQIDAQYDCSRIQEIFRKYNFVDNNGNLVYNNTEIVFHVSKSFWEQRCNEVIIGELFFELNAVQYVDNPSFKFNVFMYCPRSQDPVDIKNVFGELNPDGINQKVVIQNKQEL